MFTFLSRFRRQTAVLTALALVASVLVAVPAAAADPKADYTATFDACAGVGSSDFTDVPAGHENAGDIDCIAYYGITQGTSPTTYSPLASVTREHMALFLTRLAGLVGIDMVSDPDDAGFTDIGDLSDESQTAINQLADLDITQGTSATTFSPGDSVRRDHMALFITRLMDKMDPFADPGAPDGAAAFAYIPKQVVVVEDDDDTPADESKDVMSPFGDLGSTTKTAYDAITALWELGVASGISDTAYAPESSITRAAMADFMAGVLDHSNARPAGVTMQVDKTSDFGDVSAVRAISVRDDSFAPLGDVSVKVFTATVSGGIDDDTGKCINDDVCDWSDNDEITNADGNNFDRDTTTVATTGADGTGNGNTKASETWYAWMGSEDNDEFVKGESGVASVTLTAKADALGIRVSADINKNADANTVNIGKDTTVVLTAQLIDNAGADAATLMDAKAVAKEGVEISVTAYTQQTVAVFPLPASMKTDANGQVMLEITGLTQDDDDDSTQTRADQVTFGGDVDKGSEADTASRQVTVNWTDVAAEVTTSKVDAPSYVIIDDDKVSIAVVVSYYDQYGNPAASGDRLTITVGDTSGAEGTFATSGDNIARVRSSGTARLTANIKAVAGEEKAVVVSALQTASGVDADDPDAVLAVRHAHKNDDGVSGNRDTADTNQVIVDPDNDRFIIDTGDGTGDTIAGVLYSYDSGDTFIGVDDSEVDIDKFEEAIATTGNTVTVVFYSTDGVSIFSVASS